MGYELSLPSRREWSARAPLTERAKAAPDCTSEHHKTDVTDALEVL
jgi:hypothetical protein